jgi:hypothetical protein
MEFQRLGVDFVLHPVHDEGTAAFLRAVGSGNFEHLAFSQYAAFPTTSASHRQSAGSRTFVIDLPCNPIVGLGWMRKRKIG